MAQAGIHGMIGIAVGRWMPNRTWLMLGIVIGNMLPDADALAVAIATLAKLPHEGLHRTFSHSIIAVVAVILMGYIMSLITKRPVWRNLGLGLGIGMIMHIMVDLLIWFRGVGILWPLPMKINLWSTVTTPGWWHKKLEYTLEFLCIALFFILLKTIARKRGTDGDFLGKLQILIIVQCMLFVILTALVYTMGQGFLFLFGGFYLLALGMAFGVTIRMRATVESISSLRRD